MHFQSALLLLAATAASAAPSLVHRQTCSPTSILENGSFESGATPWTLAGGARITSNSETNMWGFSATDGAHFAILESSNANASSSIVQSVSGLDHTAQFTLSFDWNYLMSSNSHGPPSIYCTLQSSFYDGLIPQSWTRYSAQGGSGHVQETFNTNLGAGDLKIDFSCKGDSLDVVHSAGVAIDNVKFSPVC